MKTQGICLHGVNRTVDHCQRCEDLKCISNLERQVAALTKERDGWKQQCEDHCGTISGLLRENMEKHQVYCPHCNPCRHAEQLAAAQAVNAKLRETVEFHADFDDCTACKSALDLPSDTTALQARLAEERERCAKVCETLRVTHGNGDPDGDECATAIRSMK